MERIDAVSLLDLLHLLFYLLIKIGNVRLEGLDLLCAGLKFLQLLQDPAVDNRRGITPLFGFNLLRF